MNSTLENIPDISFIDNETIDNVINQMINDYQEEYERQTGKPSSLAKSDPFRMIIYACAVQIYNGFMYTDRAGKQNFLKYAYGDFLDNLGTLRGITRLQPTSATTTVRFSIASALTSALPIPQNTRVSNGNGVFFATDEYAEIPIGATYVDVHCTCTSTGSANNGFVPGEINSLVETLPYITSVTNLTETEGGSNLETDDALKDRIYIASSAFSTAGPSDAYAYWTKTVSTDIVDVKVTSPEPCEVKVVFVLKDGELPGTELINKVDALLQDGSIKPLTDHVTVAAPTAVTFNVNVTYYISSSNSAAATSIQAAVNNAVDNYIRWQSESIGRNINPSMLISLMMQAGANRVVVTAPSYTTVDGDEIAQIGTKNVVYGGIEEE